MEPLRPIYTISEDYDIVYDKTLDSKVELIFQFNGDPCGFVKMGFIRDSVLPEYGTFLGSPNYRYVPVSLVGTDDNLVMDFEGSAEFDHLIFERFYRYLYDFCTNKGLFWPQKSLEHSKLYLRSNQPNNLGEADTKYREERAQIYDGDPQNPFYQSQIAEMVRLGFPREDSHRNDHVDFLINYFEVD